MIYYIIKSILNNLKRNLFISLINILGLALCFLVALIIIGHIQNELKYDKNTENRDRLFRLETNWALMPSFVGHALTQDLGGYKNVRMFFQEDLPIHHLDNDPLLIESAVFADSTFFDILPFKLKHGDIETALTIPFQIYFTEKEAARLFGDKDPIGELIVVGNQFTFQVAGILENEEFSHLKFGAVLSMISLPEVLNNADVLTALDGWDYPTYILAPENVSKDEAEESINQCLFKYHYKYFIKRFKLRSYDEVYFATNVINEAGTIHGNRKGNKTLLLISIFIIVLAVINYVNLNTASTYKRYKWVGINRILGASKNRIILQFLIETILICILSLWVSILALEIINPHLTNLFSVNIFIPDLYTFKNIVLITLIIIFLGIISGIYPAYLLSRYLPIYLVKNQKSNNQDGVKIIDILTVFQFIIAVGLITSTIFINRQFRFISDSELGFKSEQVLLLRTNSDLEKQLDVFRERLMEHPEILKVSYSLRIPGTEWGSWCCTRIDGEENKYFNLAADPNYLSTLNIKLKSGRNFDWDNRTDYNGAFILNEAAVKEYGLKNPIGKFIDITGNGNRGTIIGIVEDFHYRGFHHKIDPVIIYWDTKYLRFANILIKENEIDQSILILKDIWEDLFLAYPFDYEFLDEKFDQQYTSDKIFGRLVGVLTIIAGFIACIGILGFSFFYLNRQVKNIGIRKVHGANFGILVKMLLSDIAKRIGIAFIIVVPIIYYSVKIWLDNFAYKINITIWPFIIGVAITLSIVLVTVFWQTIKAAKRNPVDSLRYE